MSTRFVRRAVGVFFLAGKAAKRTESPCTEPGRKRRWFDGAPRTYLRAGTVCPGGIQNENDNPPAGRRDAFFDVCVSNGIRPEHDGYGGDASAREIRSYAAAVRNEPNVSPVCTCARARTRYRRRHRLNNKTLRTTMRARTYAVRVCTTRGAKRIFQIDVVIIRPDGPAVSADGGRPRWRGRRTSARSSLGAVFRNPLRPSVSRSPSSGGTPERVEPFLYFIFFTRAAAWRRHRRFDKTVEQRSALHRRFIQRPRTLEWEKPAGILRLWIWNSI